ncbi:MAG: SCO1664 family protein [Candidatus Limnocylindrales bacterium]
MRPDERVPQLTHGEGDRRPWAAGSPIDTADALALLREGELEVVGRVRDASNLVLLCEIGVGPREADAEAGERRTFHVAYKPIRGERPLDDFPSGTLAAREEAAWWVSETLGWRVVPPTIVRDGPAGRGAVQLWIDTDDHVDVLRMILVRDDRLRPMAVFDALVNNADRKGGHLLVTEDDEVHGVDHGICFAVEPKLRTVLWGWRGERLTGAERTDIERVCSGLDGALGDRLTDLLSAREIDALRTRAQRLLADGTLPLPDPYAHVIPWPPF